MFVKNFLLLFLSNILFINSQNNTTDNNSTTNQTQDPYAQQKNMIMAYKNTCFPSPIGIDILSAFQDDCTKLDKFPTNESEFYCCSLEFQEKENKSAPVRKGCMAFLTNYIDNDRYEDIIDYIERGKQDQMKTYSIFLGKTLSEQFDGFLKNRTKYKVNKFDCSFKYIVMKFFIKLVLIILLF